MSQRPLLPATLLLSLCGGFFGCTATPDPQVHTLSARVTQLEQKLAQTRPESYAPGLGEIMGQTQLRHAKLFFAGRNSNWELASYELDEIKEGLEDAGRLHPTHKTVPGQVGQMIATYMDGPLQQLQAAVDAKNGAAFEKAFDALTAGCNGCHQASQFGFNVVIRPTTPPFSNQEFAPAGR